MLFCQPYRMTMQSCQRSFLQRKAAWTLIHGQTAQRPAACVLGAGSMAGVWRSIQGRQRAANPHCRRAPGRTESPVEAAGPTVDELPGPVEAGTPAIRGHRGTMGTWSRHLPPRWSGESAEGTCRRRSGGRNLGGLQAVPLMHAGFRASLSLRYMATFDFFESRAGWAYALL